ncbi:hypothetical protein A3F00_03450 [Candidatus Daviesbacteria bacterium RIFCSPHIGHO2_12_FULL_37_11]|uniref:DUF1648 domain-containing protein n=1 Tax=Candidatus Daviesbacteria bacterium RIFCSPHIGHO2_12_FULL_37_11 TaxID=1797777 RepID=A0A1F5KCN3_9BACT|nr:MAG: hypothetical protein A2111_00790 [Candidatus Daviesbacteria bacterium GWA1_38_6]OGE18031.1 MAG: hypothetical protein A2769_01190 [Candidatus Daviesbacteria bacterium RIFCSPHIGHO2_01_FULL_37_27]OGE38697.1 MAG: hypothetical protein A3F00_03450 [Candidatus Daviesbacteria bacterium RIFCSPHIGHO2_12_FULL_37_11]OGE45787.1 MAG: hypothetical protein A3B39_00990 [Candidatus Daviesbacteria bacterium RIFCSPLOWO2_01_FULL_37_10]
MSRIHLSSLLSFVSVITAIILGLFVFFSAGFLPKRLPLFYSLPWGEKQLATPQQFLIIPALIICISLINLMFSWQLHERQHFFMIILSVTSLITTIILAVSVIKVILLFV